MVAIVADEPNRLRVAAAASVAGAIARVSPDVAIRHVWPHLAALFAVLMLVALLPWLSTGFL